MTPAIAEQNKPNTPPPLPAETSSPSVNIAVSRIVPSPWNRKAEVDDLVESVRKNGVTQNVIVRPHRATEEDVALYSMKSDPFGAGDSIFQLVAGERRWGAAKKAGRSHVPAAVRQLSDIDAMGLQIDENENRENLSPMDRAEAYDRLRILYQEAHGKERGYTEAKCIDQVAAKVNKEPRTVYQIIQLKKLIWQARDALRNGEMDASHGYEMCRRSEEEQLELLAWIRTETQHSKGDAPSVRRLRDVIRRIDIAADEKKRQQALFKESAKESLAGSVQLTFDGKTIDLTPGPLPGSVRTAVQKCYPPLSTAHFLKDGRVQLAVGLTGSPFYLTVRELQNMLSTGVPYAIPTQKAAAAPSVAAPAEKKKEPDWIERKAPIIQPTKAPTAAQIKKTQAAQARQEEKQRKAQRESLRNAQIEKKFQAAFFAALASKAQISSRLLTHVLPDMIFQTWEDGLPIEAFAQSVLQWPAPKDAASGYSYNEVRAHAVKHTRKFTSKLLAAILITQYQNSPTAVRLAKYFSVDAKKLRKKAAVQIAEEERKARLPKVPSTQKEKQLYAAVRGNDPTWSKMRRKGVGNGEIIDFLKERMGDGGQSSKAFGAVAYKARIPAVWFNTHGPSGAPSLHGAALIAAVRDLLKIPEKGDVDV